jgi:hypothetical protein
VKFFESDGYFFSTALVWTWCNKKRICRIGKRISYSHLPLESKRVMWRDESVGAHSGDSTGDRKGRLQCVHGYFQTKTQFNELDLHTLALFSPPADSSFGRPAHSACAVTATSFLHPTDQYPWPTPDHEIHQGEQPR